MLPYSLFVVLLIVTALATFVTYTLARRHNGLGWWVVTGVLALVVVCFPLLGVQA